MSSHVQAPATHGASRKRKDREPSDTPRTQVAAQAEPGPPSESVQPFMGKNNRLLAGYLAHEFLTRGTLFGNRWESGRSEPLPGEESNPPVRAGEARDTDPGKPARSYAEVSHFVMRADGAHVPGVVNPTQLARWLQM